MTLRVPVPCVLFSQPSASEGLSRGVFDKVQQLVREHACIVREEAVPDVSHANLRDTVFALMLEGGPSVKLHRCTDRSPKRASSLLRNLQYRC